MINSLYCLYEIWLSLALYSSQPVATLFSRQPLAILSFFIAKYFCQALWTCEVVWQVSLLLSKSSCRLPDCRVCSNNLVCLSARANKEYPSFEASESNGPLTLTAENAMESYLSAHIQTYENKTNWFHKKVLNVL